MLPIKNPFSSHESLYKQSQTAMRDQQWCRLSRTSFLFVRTNFARPEMYKNSFIYSILFYSCYAFKREERGKRRELSLLENPPKRFLHKRSRDLQKATRGGKMASVSTPCPEARTHQRVSGEKHIPHPYKHATTAPYWRLTLKFLAFRLINFYKLKSYWTRDYWFL